MTIKILSITACTALLLSACGSKTETPTMTYPQSKKVDTVDTYFGEQVADPYRWLENDTTSETADWVKAQNEVTFGYLASIPYRETVKKRLQEVYFMPLKS